MVFSEGLLQRQITEAIEKLRQLTQINVQHQWRFHLGDISTDELDKINNWTIAQLNERDHIAWPSGQQVLWLAQQIRVPQQNYNYSLAGLGLRLALSWWAEDCQIYINSQWVQAGDLFDCSTRILLSAYVQPDDQFTIALRLVSPGHDAGALVRSVCIYEPFTLFEDRENPKSKIQNPKSIDPGFVADEVAVLFTYFNRSSQESELEILASELQRIQWDVLPDDQAFDFSLSQFRHHLQSRLLDKNPALNFQINLLGHAHLDLAWLWPVAETWDAAQRTFESVLHLQQDFPELIFCHSTPALYAWIEEHRPDLFAKIQQKIAAGRWEVTAGLWVEPDLNLIAGESIVRQVFYGQRYCLEKFGEVSQTAWLPDTFGFCWQIPQIFKLGGIEYFITQKLRWNDTTKFPYSLFRWQSPDGTQLIGFMTALIGETIDAVKMAKHSVEWEEQTGLNTSFWLPGVGDHGGGPTRDMLEVAQYWQQSPFFPKMQFQQAKDYLANLLETSANLPVWQDELYLEFHRGCYTTHADQKRYNRRCEALLYQAELFAAWSTLRTGAVYPQAELEHLWKAVLFNQFHDILPGSSIPEVYVDANQAWQDVLDRGQKILDGALDAIASSYPLPPPPQPDAQPIFVFNSLNWSRSEVVAVPLSDTETEWDVYETNGRKLLSQRSQNQLLFVATGVSGVGFRVFWLCRRISETLTLSDFGVADNVVGGHDEQSYTINLAKNEDFVNLNKNSQKSITLENEFLQVFVDTKTGEIGRIYDKMNQREVLGNRSGNQLQCFEDSGQYWDAWNINPDYFNHPLPSPTLNSITWIEQGPIQWRLRIVKTFNQSEFCQDYILQVSSPLLKIQTRVNWLERHVLVKVAFPLNLEADFATYETACGAIQRTTKPQTEAEKAKWEVPAFNWADMGDGNYGISLLNDYKSGYNAQPDQIRLTLLRGSTWPDPEADLGIHEFTYHLYPHSGSWQEAKTVYRGYELNLPLTVKFGCSNPKDSATQAASDVGQFLNLSNDNLILMALKQSEADPNIWILRCYECYGEATELDGRSLGNFTILHPVNLLEQPSLETPELVAEQTFKILPWKITSFAIQ